MTENSTEEVLARIGGWLGDEPGYLMDESGRITAEGDPPIELAVTSDDDRVTLSWVSVEPGAGAARADQVVLAVPDRGTSLHAGASVDRNGVTITLSNHIYVDGMTRQAFMTALNELVAAIDVVSGKATVETPAPVDAAETQVMQPQEEAAETVVQEAVASTAAATAWNPTHKVPGGGMRAWAEPDPAQQPMTRLEAGVELVVQEQRGDWAHVVGSNGWTGWVDARQLVAAGAAIARPAGSTLNVGGVELRPLPLIGAAALIVSAFLPWIKFGSGNGFDVPVGFLWDLNASTKPELGWFLVGLGVIALAVSVMRNQATPLVLFVGILGAAIAVAFVVQIYRGVDQLGGTFGDIFDWLGFAPWIALGAGVILIASASGGSARR